jgi:FkbM family methyltransferase
VLAPATIVASVLWRAMQFVKEVQHLLDVLAVVPATRERLKVMWLWWAFSLRQSGRLSREFSMKLTWQGPNGPLTATVSDLSELKIIREIFFGREYIPPEGVDPAVIVDLGSNAGFSVLFFKSLYPNARVVAVEPHPGTFERLCLNTAHLDGVDLVNAAVTDHDGEVTLYSGTESWSAGLTSADTRSTAWVIPAVTLGRLADDLKLPAIDLLKMDIEGSETQVLSSSQSALRETQTVMFEFHQEHYDGTLWTLLDRLPDFRLVRLKGDSREHPVVTLIRTSPAR